MTVNDLYQHYPDFHIDVEREQQLLLAHDIIIFQYPFYWYSTPAILKEWQDLVLEHGFAYGQTGNALHHKWILSALSTGGSANAYTHEGVNHFTLRELLAPIEQTANLCGMNFLPPFVVYGSLTLKDRVLLDHTEDYRALMTALRDQTLDLSRASEEIHINDRLHALIGQD